MPSGHAYAKAVRTVKTCVGTDFCRFGLGDAIGVGIELERRWRASTRRTRSSRRSPAARATAPRPTSRTSAWSRSRAAGRSTSAAPPGATVRKGDLLATRRAAATRRSALALAFLQHYRENAEYLERTYAYVERVGIDAVREAVLERAGDELLERYRIAKAAADPDPWRERHDPVHPKQFAELDSDGAADDAVATDAGRSSAASTTSRCSRAAASSVDGRRIAIFRLLDGFAAIDAALPARRRPAGRRHRRRLAASPARCTAGASTSTPASARRTGPDEVAVHERPRRGRTRSGCGSRERRQTTCPYCGVGCGLVAEVEDGRLAGVRGDATHPVNRGATCRKPTRLPEAVHAPDRATTPMWRGGLDERWRAGGAGGRSISASGRASLQRPSQPGGDRVLHLRPAADRGLLRGQQAGQGLPRHQQRRLQLAAVHVERRRGLHGRARLRRPAAVLRRHRRGRRACSCSAPTPPPATRSSGTGSRSRGRVPDRRRPAPHADRRARRPAPAGPARHRPAAAERDAARDRARRSARPDVPRAPHARAPRTRSTIAAEWTPERAARGVRRPGRGHRRGRAPLRRDQARDGAVVDGRRTSRRSAR